MGINNSKQKSVKPNLKKKTDFENLYNNLDKPNRLQVLTDKSQLKDFLDLEYNLKFNDATNLFMVTSNNMISYDIDYYWILGLKPDIKYRGRSGFINYLWIILNQNQYSMITNDKKVLILLEFLNFDLKIDFKNFKIKLNNYEYIDLEPFIKQIDVSYDMLYWIFTENKLVSNDIGKMVLTDLANISGWLQNCILKIHINLVKKFIIG